MTTNRPLSLFISSKMQELAEERRAIRTALQEFEMHGWLWEDDAGARPEPIRSTYLAEVEACDIYLGLFWLGYGPYTIEEFERACQLRKPCLVYEKYVNIEQRNPELVSFLYHLQAVENLEGLTVYHFETSTQLAKQVQTDVMRLLTTRFRENRQQPSARLWNVPYRKNPFFTGREDVLKLLRDKLKSTKTATLTQPQAINGLGGIGKTQIALEYAYLYREDYRSVLWVNAVTRESIIRDFIDVAELLQLPEREGQDQNKAIVAVKRWFAAHDGWLLILDNADDLDIIGDFLPITDKGHILITTRAQATGSFADPLQVEKMDMHEGMLLLLRRAKRLAPHAPLAQATTENQAEAEAIVAALDGFPLAIDQAGSYIEEIGCQISSYLSQYEHRQIELLKRRGMNVDHPEPVATTWSLSFERVEAMNPLAADLMRVFAFLNPDNIPEEMIVAGGSKLGTTLQAITSNHMLIDDAIGILRRYSLVDRNRDDNSFTIHRLVQVVLKEAMSKAKQRQWAKRVVQAVNQAFPDVTMESRLQCKRFLSQALACANLIEQYQLVHWVINLSMIKPARCRST